MPHDLSTRTNDKCALQKINFEITTLNVCVSLSLLVAPKIYFLSDRSRPEATNQRIIDHTNEQRES